MMNVNIFARMTPEHKVLLITSLKKCYKTYIGMCGDGANDCSALKAADIGISLSEAEASIAAPFTSAIFDISCVPILLREGRCSLATAFACFKFMELYSALEFITVTLLYFLGEELKDREFLYIDLFIVIPLGLTMGQSNPYKKLKNQLPLGSLINARVILSIFGCILI